MSKTVEKRRIGVALCGFGRAGRIHFNGLRQNPRCSLRYVVDQLENKVAGADSMLDISVRDFVRQKLDEYNLDGTQLVNASDLDRVLKDPEVDAMIVASPTDTHEEYILRSLEAGKAVFCEKPISFTVEGTVRCYEKAEEVGLPLYCAFQRRFDPSFSDIYQQVKEGKIGQVYQIKTTSRDSPRPSIEYIKLSNQVFHDCGVHDFDLICWLLGEEPVGVFAQAVTVDPEIAAVDDFDTCAIVLKFPSGVLATTDLSRHANYGYDQRLEVYGEKGMLICENPRKDSVVCYNSQGTCASNTHYSFPQRYELAYKRELDSFISSVLDPTRELLVTKNDILLSLRVAEACHRSNKEGRMVALKPLPSSKN